VVPSASVSVSSSSTGLNRMHRANHPSSTAGSSVETTQRSTEIVAPLLAPTSRSAGPARDDDQVQIGPIAPSVRLHNTVHNVRRHGERAGEVCADNILERLLRGAGLRHTTPLREHRKYRRHRHVCQSVPLHHHRSPTPHPLDDGVRKMFCMSRLKNRASRFCGTLPTFRALVCLPQPPVVA
jgi:hypothetical protein